MSTPTIHIADIEHTAALFSLSEICERCGVKTEIIVEMVEYGIVAPVTQSLTAESHAVHAQHSWQFNLDALIRLYRAQRLRRDLELNLPGLALSLELMDQVDTLKQQITTLRHELSKHRDE
ncbi:MAG: hypothetical protein JWM78_390 [Verrucomicrobiaceae bacterium]|nr:hypothetical protein [Verrucomicrobiaceae bacterium]